MLPVATVTVAAAGVPANVKIGYQSGVVASPLGEPSIAITPAAPATFVPTMNVPPCVRAFAIRHAAPFPVPVNDPSDLTSLAIAPASSYYFGFFAYERLCAAEGGRLLYLNAPGRC